MAGWVKIFWELGVRSWELEFWELGVRSWELRFSKVGVEKYISAGILKVTNFLDTS